MTIPVRYRAEPAANLIVRPLEDITLIHHRRSGQTHMVMTPVPEILAAMDEGATDAFSCERGNPEGPDTMVPVSDSGPLPSQGNSGDDILTLLSRRYDLGDPLEALPVIAAHLEEMAALGLVHRV